MVVEFELIDDGRAGMDGTEVDVARLAGVVVEVGVAVDIEAASRSHGFGGDTMFKVFFCRRRRWRRRGEETRQCHRRHT